MVQRIVRAKDMAIALARRVLDCVELPLLDKAILVVMAFTAADAKAGSVGPEETAGAARVAMDANRRATPPDRLR